MAKKNTNKNKSKGSDFLKNVGSVVKDVVGNTMAGKVVKGAVGMVKNPQKTIATIKERGSTSYAPGKPKTPSFANYNPKTGGKPPLPSFANYDPKTGGKPPVPSFANYDPRGAKSIPKLIKETSTARKQLRADDTRLSGWQGMIGNMNANKAARAGVTAPVASDGSPVATVPGQPTPAPQQGGGNNITVNQGGGVPSPQGAPAGTPTLPPAPGENGSTGSGYVPGQNSSTTETTTTTGGPVDQVNSDFDLDSRINEIKTDSLNRVRQAQDLLNQQREMLDSSTNALIDSINSKYEARISDMSETNSRFYATAEKQGMRSGRSRYAPLVEAGILTGEEEAGIQRIAGLQSEQLSLIQQAQQAKDASSLAMLTQFLDRIDDVHKEKMGAINDMYDLAVRHENLALDRQRENRLATEAQFTQSIKLAEKIAPTFIDDISKFTNPDEKMEYVRSIANDYNIDPLVLLAGIEEASKDDRKSQLELEKLSLDVQGKRISNNKSSGGGSGDGGSSGRKDQGQQFELKNIGTGRIRRAAKAGISEDDIKSYGSYLVQGGTPDEYRKAQIEAGVLAPGSKGYSLVKKYAKKIKQ